MGEEICLTALTLPTKLTDNLYIYQKNRILCDFCIQCSDGEVYAHKIILAMWGMHGFYIDTIDTIQALNFSTADFNNFMEFIYSGNSSLNLDAAIRVAQIGKLLGIQFHRISSSLTQHDSLESILFVLKSASESSVERNEKYTLYIKSMPDYQRNFSTTTNVRCREPSTSTHSMPGNHGNSITDKWDKNLEECLLSQSSDVGSDTLINDNKSAESPTTDNKVDDTSEYEKATGHRDYSDKPLEKVSVIQVKTENLVWPESENTEVKTEQEDCAMESGSESVETSRAAENNTVGEWSVETSKTADISDNNSVGEGSEFHTEGQNNISERKKSPFDIKDTGQKKTEAQEGEWVVKECRHCLKQNRKPFIYATTTKGREKYNRHAIRFHPSAYIRNVNCEICEASWRRCQADVYMEHIVKTHGVEYDSTVYQKKTCDFDNCEYWTVCESKFLTHQKNVHYGKLSVCDVCGEAFKDIKSHKETHKDRPKIPCEICGNTFVNQTSVKNHIERVHEKKYKSAGFCKYCNQNFKERYKYFKHMFTEHKEIPKGMKRYQCSECDFVTYQMSLLKTHELRHKELKGLEIERNHKCNVCEKAFLTKAGCRYHVQRLHVTQAYLQCHYEGCTKVFRRKPSLEKHIRSIHEVGKIYQCHACPYKCNRQGNLVKHIRSIHKEEVSTRASRRKEAMLSGKGYHEAVRPAPWEVQGSGKSIEGESSLSKQRHWTLSNEGVNSDQDSRGSDHMEEEDSRGSDHIEEEDNRGSDHIEEEDSRGSDHIEEEESRGSVHPEEEDNRGSVHSDQDSRGSVHPEEEDNRGSVHSDEDSFY
ncbi:GDNF-inducible zinc finger protein 1-like [Saccostrea cucullata]|uniref:GDNF-inducible zinc finger protein 1-like n=1 Tax=Saccostrea cuccullata TaxID=36930 RepID=UPI002ED2B40F